MNATLTIQKRMMTHVDVNFIAVILIVLVPVGILLQKGRQSQCTHKPC